MRKSGKIIVGIFSVIFIAAFGLLVAFNWQSIKALFNGQIIYTQEQVDEIKNDTWEEAIKQEDLYLHQIESFKQAVEENEILINSLNSQVSALTQQNQSLTISKEELETNINSLSLQVEDLNKTVNENKTTIDSLNSRIEELENSNNSNLEQIESLKSQVETLKDANVKYEATVNSLNNTIELLNLQLVEFEEEEIELNTQISNLQQTIQEYQNEIENYKQIIEDLKEINSCVVTFKVNNIVVSTQQVGKTDSPEVIEDPTGDFVFEGWVVEGTENIVDPFTYSIVEDTVFVAKVRIMYNITFTADGKIVNTQSLEYGNGLVLPTNPEKEHYTFVGWSLDGVNVIDPLTYEIEGDTNFIAVFEIANQLPFTFENGVLTSYTGNDTEITIPESYSIVDGYFVEGNDITITTIGDSVFKDNLVINSVSLPKTIKHIGEEAFRGCSNLTYLNCENVSSYGNRALMNCANLRELTLSNSGGLDFSYVIQNAFDGLTGLRILNYDVPELSSSISNYSVAFTNLGMYSDELIVNIGENVTILPDTLFAGTYITTLNFPVSSNLTEIKDGCFANTKITNLVLPEGLTRVGSNAFRISTLKELTLPESLRYAGHSAFECENLEKLYFNCAELFITEEDDNSYIFEHLGKTSSNLQIIFGESVGRITNDLFSRAYFTSIVFDSCYEIGAGAFSSRYATITSVILPSNVRYIGDYAFYSISSLTEITLLSEEPPTLYGNNIAQNIEKIYIPQGTLNAYQSAKNWSTFADIFIEI